MHSDYTRLSVEWLTPWKLSLSDCVDTKNPQVVVLEVFKEACGVSTVYNCIICRFRTEMKTWRRAFTSTFSPLGGPPKGHSITFSCILGHCSEHFIIRASKRAAHKTLHTTWLLCNKFCSKTSLKPKSSCILEVIHSNLQFPTTDSNLDRKRRDWPQFHIPSFTETFSIPKPPTVHIKLRPGHCARVSGSSGTC